MQNISQLDKTGKQSDSFWLNPSTDKITMTKTATSCLKDLDITDATVFDDCDNTDEEMATGTLTVLLQALEKEAQ